MTYQDKLAAFADLAVRFEPARVHHAGKPWNVCGPGEEVEWTGYCKPANGDGCGCCGTKRLKTLYPVVLDGEVEQVEWIGRECHENLQKMGKLGVLSMLTVEV